LLFNSPTGEIEVFHDLPRLVHARAVRTSSILVLPAAVFEDYMVMNPEVKRIISNTARQRFSVIQACALLHQRPTYSQEIRGSRFRET
jgi:CRP-like cAMP-binding protein